MRFSIRLNFAKRTVVFRLLFLFLISLLTACQTTTSVQINPNPHLLDKSFAGFENIPIETERDIFALSPEARTFVITTLNGVREPTVRIERLVDAIFDRSDFNMIYDNSANTIASDTFANRSANCLSLSIMTYALAKEAGIDVRFREIEIPEYWTRKDGFSLINGHINLRLHSELQADKIYFDNRSMVVDFDPFSPKKYFPARGVDKDRVLAMFYNNKGADALVKASYKESYAYFREALLVDPQFQDAWANMGILYRMTGHYDWAENTYTEALRLNQDNLTIWENLAVLHKFMGRDEEAREIEERVDFKRQRNPYYHFIQGEQEFEAQEYSQALAHYRKAIHLDSSHHEFYFGMAKVHAALGNKASAMSWLKKAKRRSSMDDVKERYQNKMDLFAAL
jgi:tetratricopeptide (TPR) repeat protein